MRCSVRDDDPKAKESFTPGSMSQRGLVPDDVPDA